MITMKVHKYISKMYGLDVFGIIEKTRMCERDAVSIFKGQPLTEKQAKYLSKLGRSTASWIFMDRDSRKQPDKKPDGEWESVKFTSGTEE